ncbi:unnamed protein product [Lota lota]
MFPANLLLLMVLLLPQASSGRQGRDASQVDHGRASSTPPSLTPPTPPPAPLGLEPGLSQTIQGLLLERLGLQAQPDPRPGAAVPRYLLDLYRFHQQQYHLVEDPAFSFPSRHVERANTIRSFHHTDHLKENVNAAEDQKKVHILFNVSSIPQDETLVSAELRLLWSPRASLGSGAHKLSLYLSEDKDQPGAGPLETRLLSSGLRRDTEGSWETFSLDAELLRQALAERASLGFVLEMVPENSTGSHPEPGYSSAVDPEERDSVLSGVTQKAAGASCHMTHSASLQSPPRTSVLPESKGRYQVMFRCHGVKGGAPAPQTLRCPNQDFLIAIAHVAESESGLMKNQDPRKRARGRSCQHLYLQPGQELMGWGGGSARGPPPCNYQSVPSSSAWDSKGRKGGKGRMMKTVTDLFFTKPCYLHRGAESQLVIPAAWGERLETQQGDER